MNMKRNLLDFRLRRFVVACLVSCIPVVAAYAQQSAARIDATGVTTLKQLIQRIEAGSDYRVSWRDNLPNEISVSVSGGERTVDELLKEALRDKDITYVIKQNNIILLPR